MNGMVEQRKDDREKLPISVPNRSTQLSWHRPQTRRKPILFYLHNLLRFFESWSSPLVLQLGLHLQ